VLSDFIERELARTDRPPLDVPARRPSSGELNILFRNAIDESWRQ